MQFIRKKKRGVNKKVCRVWFSEEGYRITWRKEVFGIRVPARFQACVRVVVPNYSGKQGESVQIWDFLFKPRLYKTMKAAEEDCERHRRLWTKACDAAGVRALTEVFGMLPSVIPIWARKKMNRKALAILTAPRTAKYREEDEECLEGVPPAGDVPSLADATRSSDSPAGHTEPAPDRPAPVCIAEDRDKSTTRKPRRARPKDIATSDPFIAPSVGKLGRAPKKRAKRKRKTTAASSKPASNRSKSSRKSKSRPSGSEPEA